MKPRRSVRVEATMTMSFSAPWKASTVQTCGKFDAEATRVLEGKKIVAIYQQVENWGLSRLEIIDRRHQLYAFVGQALARDCVSPSVVVKYLVHVLWHVNEVTRWAAAGAIGGTNSNKPPRVKPAYAAFPGGISHMMYTSTLVLRTAILCPLQRTPCSFRDRPADAFIGWC